MRTYYVLLKQTVDKIPSNTQYFYHTLCFYRKIFFEQKYITHSEAETVLRNTLYLWAALLKWKNLADKSDVAVSDGFEDSINNFVSVWEEWKNTYIRHKYKEVDDSYKILFEHLKYTAEMVIESLRFDNNYALSWSTDMLIHWRDKTLDVQTYDDEYLWYSEIIDIEILFKENAELWSKIRKRSDKNLESATNIALKNAYIDIRFLTVCSMLANSDNIERIKPYVDALLKEERIHSTGTIDIQVKSINQASQLLGIYIRHKKFHTDSIEKYSGWQLKLIESFSRKFSQKMVSGRIYAGWHNVSIDNEFIQLIVSYSSSKWKLSKRWLDILESNIYSFSNREDIIHNFRALIDIAQKTSEYKLLSPEKTPQEVEVYCTNFIESMEELINEIENINNRHVINSDIDKTILSEMAKVASHDFVVDETKFPMNMFDAIKKDNVELVSSNRIVAEDFKKHYIMSEDRPAMHNLVEVYSQGVVDNLKNVIFRKIIINKPTSYESFDSLENMLFYVLDTAEISHTVLLCHSSLCALVFNLYKDEQKREQFQITKSYAEDYSYKVGDCEIYDHSFDIVNSGVLTTKDRFKALVIEDFEDGNIINISFNENEQDKTKGNLSFDYKLDIETDETQPFVKLSLVTEDIEIDEEVEEVEEVEDDIIQEELNENKVLSKLSRVLKLFLKSQR